MCCIAQHEKFSSNHLRNQNLPTQTSCNCMNTNLLTHDYHRRLWLETFTPKLTPTLDQKAVAGLACNICRFSDTILDGDDHLLCKYWSASPKLRENMLAETPLTACMGVQDNNTVVIHCPSLITCSYNPKDESTSHLDAIVWKMSEMAIAGFKDLNLHELNDWDFSSQYLRDWVTHVSPKTQEGITDTIQLPAMITSNEIRIEKYSEQTWTLVRHIPLLPF